MATDFPVALDTFDTKTDNVDDVMAAHVNNLQDAIAAIQAKLGINGSSIDSSLDYKLAKVRAGERAVSVGDVKMILGTSAGAGWLLMDGSTIGDASSGATGRANADTSELFAYIWYNIANAEAPIYDSAGSASTRGASAAADFANHKRLTIPDNRGYAPTMYKSGDSDFGTMGKKVGEKTHLLSISEMPSHNHGGVTGNDSLAGRVGPVVVGSGSSREETNPGSHNHTITAEGGGQAHNNLGPRFAINLVVKY